MRFAEIRVDELVARGRTQRNGADFETIVLKNGVCVVIELFQLHIRKRFETFPMFQQIDHVARRMKGDFVQIRFFQTDANAEQTADRFPRFARDEQMFRLGEFQFPGGVLLLQRPLRSFAAVEQIIRLIVVQNDGFARAGVTVRHDLQIDFRCEARILSSFFHSNVSRLLDFLFLR